jgi:hypothetical protein
MHGETIKIKIHNILYQIPVLTSEISKRKWMKTLDEELYSLITIQKAKFF